MSKTFADRMKEKTLSSKVENNRTEYEKKPIPSEQRRKDPPFKPKKEAGLEFYEMIEPFMKKYVQEQFSLFTRTTIDRIKITTMEDFLKELHGVSLADLFEKLQPLIRGSISEIQPETTEWKEILNADTVLLDIQNNNLSSSAVEWLQKYLVGSIVGTDGKTKGRKRLQECIRYLLEFMRSYY